MKTATNNPNNAIWHDQTEFEKAYMVANECLAGKAREVLRDCQTRVAQGENPEVVLCDYGFEPDYFFDICP